MMPSMKINGDSGVAVFHLLCGLLTSMWVVWRGEIKLHILSRQSGAVASTLQGWLLWARGAWEWWVLFERAGGGRFLWLLCKDHNLTLKTKECEVSLWGLEMQGFGFLWSFSPRFKNPTSTEEKNEPMQSETLLASSSAQDDCDTMDSRCWISGSGSHTHTQLLSSTGSDRIPDSYRRQRLAAWETETLQTPKLIPPHTSTQTSQYFGYF